MTTNRKAVFFILALLLALPGCQNYLRVQVQLLDATGQEKVTEGTYRDAVLKSVASLKHFEHVIACLKKVLGPAHEVRISEPAANDLKDAKALKAEGTALAGELVSMTDIFVAAEKARVYTEKVADFYDRLQGYEEFLKEGLQDSEQLKKVQKTLAVHWSAPIAEVKNEAAAATAQAAGFGGFSGVAVHQIDASDRKYAHVLKAKPTGKPFTLVDSKAAGDSTIVFVQESPTQIRAYSVDMDPTQLAHNVIYITDKALQAAAKFAGPVP
ncbi:MAG: hypothetical protein JSU63_06265 [Phycisphaerales bacterium]|nr:MAG: hypothetical protein JSU63_06265 [Phycisphaerales bacterium]